MMHLPRVAAVLATSVALASGWSAPGLAQSGRYVMSRAAEGPDVCRLRLDADPVIGGKAVVLGRDCAKSFRWSADISVWRLAPGGELVLANPTRQGVAIFRQLADGDFIGKGPDGIDYVLTPERGPKRR